MFYGGFSGSIGKPMDLQAMRTLINTQAQQQGLSPISTDIYSYRDQKSALNSILSASEQDPNDPLILVGHSQGGDAAFDIAKTLSKQGISVDALFQIDSVGIGDGVLPKGVEIGVNLYQTDEKGWGVFTQEDVRGSLNIRVPGTTHADIDNNSYVQSLISSTIVGAHRQYQIQQLQQQISGLQQQIDKLKSIANP